MSDADLYIEADGTLSHVYRDDLADLLAGHGRVTVRRVSHVEPAATFGVAGDGWLADMRPVAGPLLGLPGEAEHGIRPFAMRQEALDAEAAWLEAAMTAGKLRSL